MGIQPCPLYGTHQMKPTDPVGALRDYQTDEQINDQLSPGLHAKCGCGVHFICAGHPEYNDPWPILDYISGGVGGAAIKYFENVLGAYTAYVDSNYISYTSSAYLDGFDFQ